MKKKNKIHEFNILGAFLQALCTIIVLLLAIVSIMNHNMFPYFEIFIRVGMEADAASVLCALFLACLHIEGRRGIDCCGGTDSSLRSE